jgi:hypothetical protein
MRARVLRGLWAAAKLAPKYAADTNFGIHGEGITPP